MGRTSVASAILGRDDAADALARFSGDADAAAAEAFERMPRLEKVTLFNGDVHDGRWLFGRKHGAGKYIFTSGATFEGKWEGGKMVGIGWFTKDGKRSLVDLRKKEGR